MVFTFINGIIIKINYKQSEAFNVCFQADIKCYSLFRINTN